MPSKGFRFAQTITDRLRPVMTFSKIKYQVKADALWVQCFTMSVLFVIWIATHPYLGITHDARLYMFEALTRLDRANFADDLYVKFGSQDNFSVYGYLLSHAVFVFGVPAGNLVVTLIGEFLWVLGALFLVRMLVPTFADRVFAFGAMIMLPSVYGGQEVFHYAESFQSPRLFAEALILISIAFAIRRAWWRSVSILASAVLIHPLLALPGIGVIFVLAAQQDRRFWLLPLAGLATLAMLSWGGVEPFVRAGQTVTGRWWDIVAQRCNFAIISEWRPIDYFRLVLQAVIAVLAYWLGQPIERRLLKAVAIVAAMALLASLIGANWLHNLLAINAQFDRATWLSSAIVNLVAGLLFIRIFSQKTFCRRYIAFGLALYALDRFFPLMMFLALLVLVTTSIILRQERRTGFVHKVAALALFSVACASSMLAVLLVWLEVHTQIGSPTSRFNMLDDGLVCSALIAAALFTLGYHRFASALVVSALIFGILNFDQRSPWQHLVDSDQRPPGPVMALINGSKTIYWEGGVELLWFDLRRTSYYSTLQGTGAMFYRQTAIEYYRRGMILSALNTSDFSKLKTETLDMPKQDPNANGPTGEIQLAKACQALPELDLIVLYTDVPGAQDIMWQAPAPQYITVFKSDGSSSVKPLTRYYFYECKNFRSN